MSIKVGIEKGCPRFGGFQATFVRDSNGLDKKVQINWDMVSVFGIKIGSEIAVIGRLFLLKKNQLLAFIFHS